MSGKRKKKQPPHKKENLYVVDRAKLECKQCSNPIGILTALADKPKIQELLVATAEDNKVPNLVFDGNCLQSPKERLPCQSVIEPGEWQDVSETLVQDNPALLYKSSIPCNYGGCDITIDYHGQKQEVKNTPAPGAPPPLENLVLDAYWADKDGKKITLQPYEDNRLRIKIKFHMAAIGSKFQVNVYELDDVSDDLMFEGQEFLIKGQNHDYSFDLTGEIFEKGGDSVQKLYFKITVEDNTQTFPNSKKDYLKLHVIRFVPVILKAKGWINAKKVQDIWFKGKANDKPWSIHPKVDLVDIDWVLGFPRMKKVYDEILNSKWNNAAAIQSLKKNIFLMIIDGQTQLPTNDDETTDFGTFSKEIVLVTSVKQPKLGKNVDEYMPLIEKYYYTSVPYKIDSTPPNLEPLDDCFGTLAACQFRVAAKGSIKKITSKVPSFIFGEDDMVFSSYRVTIEKIAIYIKDSFDFINKDGDDEYLGDWSPKKNEVDYSAVYTSSTFYGVYNSSYQEWRKDYNMGMDFHLYSTIKEISKYHEFTIGTDEINAVQKAADVLKQTKTMIPKVPL